MRSEQPPTNQQHGGAAAFLGVLAFAFTLLTGWIVGAARSRPLPWWKSAPNESTRAQAVQTKNPVHPHELRDANVPTLFKLLLFLAAAGVISHLILIGVYLLWLPRQLQTLTPPSARIAAPPPPRPRILPAPAPAVVGEGLTQRTWGDLILEYRREELGRLAELGLYDPVSDRYRIPGATGQGSGLPPGIYRMMPSDASGGTALEESLR